MASCGNEKPLQFSCDKHRQLPLHWVTPAHPPPWHRVSGLFHQCPARGGGGGHQFSNPKRDIISDLRRELQPWRGNAVSRRLLLFGPLDNAAMGFRGNGRHANQELYATASFFSQSRPEMTDDDIRWNSSNKFEFGPNADKTVKVQGFNKSISKQGFFVAVTHQQHLWQWLLSANQIC